MESRSVSYATLTVRSHLKQYSSSAQKCDQPILQYHTNGQGAAITCTSYAMAWVRGPALLLPPSKLAGLQQGHMVLEGCVSRRGDCVRKDDSVSRDDCVRRDGCEER